MKILEECREIALDIRSIDERIEEISLSVSSPKCQVLDDMPKSMGGNGNAIERYIEKKERLEEKKKRCTDRLDAQWEEAMKILKTSGITKDGMSLVYCRYYNGCTWKECGLKLNWNSNKVFREHRKVKKIYTKN